MREPTMKPTPASSRAFRLAAKSMPASVTTTRGSTLAAWWRCSTTPTIVVVSVQLLSQQPILRGDAGPVDQQPDDDLGVDPSLLGIADLAQLVLLLGLEVERGDARRHSDTSPAAMACFRGLATDGLAVAALDAAAQGSGTKACPVLCVSVLQVGVDSVGVGGGELGQGPVSGRW